MATLAKANLKIITLQSTTKRAEITGLIPRKTFHSGFPWKYMTSVLVYVSPIT
ncbi:hypothetical protein VCHA43P277_60243 [Vibrio chagasii]|nr:hypothetical protein VCHA34P126_10882 [Vibrio chagasii]CAH7166319.1 hypothetical protein VCHA41O247_10884 [Vibrio chagasii]CAH7336315.1 hypothetical protein VCHA43P277_60243 [Vibrio chagasii]CAH7481448.1 hypothetical protein VCHA50P420_70242 [Vibrio chagasii]